ncbi:MAG: heme ABC exporter ATP-binding protein CcmA [Hyphomicrobiales bacterium]|nr:heme ABC exporter ATP-binding protein CcmA [Hyphomicrobiales bacterium]
MRPLRWPERLAATGLACVRGGRQVFSEVTFTVATGQALLLTGRNGAGTSSLLRLIAGLIRPERGRVALEGGDADATTGEQAHYLGHLDALKPSLSVRENLDFWRDYLGKSPDERPPGAVGALETVGLAGIAALPAAYLSAGQRRRLSIARLVAVERPLWLLDEPTSALDAPAQTMLGAVMNAHLDRGGIIVAATHGSIGLPRAGELRLEGGA